MAVKTSVTDPIRVDFLSSDVVPLNGRIGMTFAPGKRALGATTCLKRAAPFGLAAARREDAFELARDASVITHGHPSGYLSAAYFASMIFDLARDVPFDAAMKNADALLMKENGCKETARAVARARELISKGAPSAEDIERLGGVGSAKKRSPSRSFARRRPRAALRKGSPRRCGGLSCTRAIATARGA